MKDNDELLLACLLYEIRRLNTTITNMRNDMKRDRLKLFVRWLDELFNDNV